MSDSVADFPYSFGSTIANNGAPVGSAPSPEPPQDRKIDGLDIRPLLTGAPGARSPYEVYYYYYLDQLQAVRSGPWKLFLPLDGFVRHPHFKAGEKSTPPLLFNVVEDIGSEHNVASQHPEIVARLTGLAEKIRADLGDRDQPGPGIRPIGRVEHPVPVRLAP